MEELSKKNKMLVSVITITIIIMIMSVYFHFDQKANRVAFDAFSRSFKKLTIDDEWEGVVYELNYPSPKISRNDPLQSFVTLTEGTKLNIHTGFELKTNVTLDSILRINMKLFKRAGSDTLYIFDPYSSEKHSFIFQIRDSLGYPLKKVKK